MMALYLERNDKNAHLKCTIERSLRSRRLGAYNTLVNDPGLVFADEGGIGQVVTLKNMNVAIGKAVTTVTIGHYQVLQC